ncbi:MAG: DNA polymerase/3'-5' exonuclease PolX [Deltaproteobacteria bacterium]|nr:DNA polymerase/3'-5' exonuclease PolX [Deltaproteobacteria bacterium]
MTKEDIAHVLEEIAEVLELKGENPFKVRAYANAARVVSGLAQDLGDLIAKNELIEIKGIGKNLAEHIKELYETGHLKEYEKILKSVPAGVLEMLSIPGLGPKKVKVLWDKLHLTNVGTLEHVCHQGKIAVLEGFGEKTQEKILAGIAQIKKHEGKFLYSVASQVAEEIFAKFEKHPKIKQASIAGSLRRCKEVVKDIDIVAATAAPQEVMDFFVKLPQVEKIINHGDTKSSVLLKMGMQCDLRCVNDVEYPYALHHFTGSKEHNVAMRSLAQDKGMKMNEYGLFKGTKLVGCKNETEIFAKLGMEMIPPELRENRGEIEAAQADKIPKLVEAQDIRGVFHCHSTYSDGTASLEQMANGVKELGMEYIGTADHSQAAHYAGGLTPEKIKKEFKEIDQLNKKLKGVHLFKGMEADILPSGEVDMGDKILSQFDYIVASVHSKFNMTEAEMTKRVIQAIKNKHVRILGHMTGRLLLSREGYPLKITEVIDACADYGVAIEINSNPMRLDIDWRHIPYAREKGVKFFINPDAHAVSGLSDFRYGVGIARKGGLTAKDIVNTRSLEEIKKWLNR